MMFLLAIQRDTVGDKISLLATSSQEPTGGFRPQSGQQTILQLADDWSPGSFSNPLP